MNEIVSGLTRGFFAPLAGAKLLFSSKKVFMLAMVPFLVGLGIFILASVLAYQFFSPHAGDWISQFAFIKNSPILGSLTTSMVLLLGGVVIILMNFVVGYIFIILVAGPFYALLVEEIFKMERNEKIKKAAITQVFKMFMIAILKVIIFLFVGLICFILAFIPMVNIFSSFFLFLLISFDCADYSFEVDQLGLRERFAFVQKHFWEFAGFSLAIICISVFPGAFFLLLPAFIIGAAKMYIQLTQKPV